jgi:hypothetical protein
LTYQSSSLLRCSLIEPRQHPGTFGLPPQPVGAARLALLIAGVVLIKD